MRAAWSSRSSGLREGPGDTLRSGDLIYRSQSKLLKNVLKINCDGTSGGGRQAW